MDAEPAAVIGAGRCKRTDECTLPRTGTHPKTFSITAGNLQLRLSKLRTDSLYLSLLERRRRIDVTLFAVVAEAYVHGAYTRRSMTSSRSWAWHRGSAIPE